MVTLEYYLYDGACAQAKAVLAYLQERYETILDPVYKAGQEFDHYDGAVIFVNRHEYDREHGYVFSIRYNGKQVNYGVFEHCVSDDLCVVRTTEGGFTPNIWKDGWKKYEHTKTFPYFSIKECGDWIVNDMQDFLDGEKDYNKEKEELVKKANKYCYDNGAVYVGRKPLSLNYFGEERTEEIEYVYNDDDNIVVVSSWYKDDEGKEGIDYTRLEEFSNDEIKKILAISGIK